MKNHLPFLFLLVFIFITSCIRDENSEEINVSMRTFNNQKANFDKIIGLNYEVDWNNARKGFSVMVNKTVESYPIIIKDNINKKNYTSYFLIVAKDDNKNITLFLLKSSASENSLNKFPDIFDQKNFTGFLKLLDVNHNVISNKRYISGVFFGDKKDFSNKRDAENTDCYTIETYHYTDYYWEYADGTLSYKYTSLDYVSYDTYCNGTAGESPYNTEKQRETRNEIIDETLTIDDYIDESKLDQNPCAKSVYDKLKANSTFFNNLLSRFKGKSMVNLDFDFQNLGNSNTSILGNTNLNRLYYYGQATITFNQELTGSSELLLASFLIHEMLHAKFASDLVKVGWDGNKYKDIAKIDQNNLPTLLQDYYKYNYDGEIADHNHIANWYVDLITEALAAYDNNQHTESYYELLAWSGLSQSEAYNVKTIDQQTEIYNIYITNLKTEPCKK